MGFGSIGWQEWQEYAKAQGSMYLALHRLYVEKIMDTYIDLKDSKSILASLFGCDPRSLQLVIS